MNTLPKYRQGSPARFDFRIPDGLGHWVFPDWDDPGLKVEIYDEHGELRLTATVASSPGLTQGNDYDETHNPEGGPFAAIEGIDLAGFALGVAEAWVYAQVDGTAVLPYPTILAAFEVVADAAPGPLYATVDQVQREVPGTWPESITDAMVMQAVADASREIDAIVGACYDVPFADVADDPPPPAVIEIICRRLAAAHCLEWMGRVNAATGPDLRQAALDDLLRLIPEQGVAPLVRLPGYRGPVAVYQGELVRADEMTEDVLE